MEIMDQEWCPDRVRDGITDYLRWFEHFWNFYEPIFPRLKQVLRELRSGKIVDLCSGGGGPWVNLYRELDDLKECAPTVYLTDLYPNGSALEVSRSISSGRIHFYSEPVSATNVPTHLTGFRTLFSAFHHFPPPMAKLILIDAMRSNQGIAIFEITRRSLIVILVMCFSPLFVLCTTPFVKPFHWWRLFWTYIIPAIPFAFMFDSIVSCVRTYSPQELQELTEGITGGLYHWEYGIEPPGHPSGGITYLIGYPVPEKDVFKEYEAGHPHTEIVN
jgi:hypothetical protein